MLSSSEMASPNLASATVKINLNKQQHSIVNIDLDITTRLDKLKRKLRSWESNFHTKFKRLPTKSDVILIPELGKAYRFSLISFSIMETE